MSQNESHPTVAPPVLPGSLVPRVKPEHEIVRAADHSRVLIGGQVYGVAAEVTDRTGAVWTLLRAMDGTRTLAQVIEHVVAAHPAERPEAVRTAVARFAAAGYLEDVSAPDPVELTARDKQRYDRSRRFFRWTAPRWQNSSWDSQVRLAGARVVVVGLGGTGGPAALALVASGVGSLYCVDGDEVELSNLNRQVLYQETDLGQAKVSAAVRRLAALNSDVRVSGRRQRIDSEADLDPLIGNCDVLLLCADQPAELRAWTNRACLRGGVAWVDAGYAGPLVTATAYRPGQGPCYECVRAAGREHNEALGIGAGQASSPRAPVNAVTAPVAGISGHLAAHLAIALITGTPPERPGQVIGLNLVAPDQHIYPPIRWRADCPACGGPR